jgi:GNAT superfamily N-acetyltransferase
MGEARNEQDARLEITRAQGRASVGFNERSGRFRWTVVLDGGKSSHGWADTESDAWWHVKEAVTSAPLVDSGRASRDGRAPRPASGGPGGDSDGCTVRSIVDVSIRTGEPSDAAFIVDMARLASAVQGRPLPRADDPQLALGLPLTPDAGVLATDHDGRPLGAAWWHFREPLLVVTPDGAPVPELVIAVVPTDRGRGVGRRLLDALVARAAHEGHDRLALNVHLHNPAARLYSRAGFVVAGRGRGPLGVAMVRDLP